MTTGLPSNTSGTARLLLGAPGYAVGWQEVIYMPSPAAGDDWTYTVDGRYFERLVSARWVLTTSSTVASRVARLVLDDVNGTRLLSVQATGQVAASTVIDVNLAAGLGVLSSGTSVRTWGTLPDLLLPPGYTWSARTASLQSGDTESGIVLIVQRYPNDTAAMPVSP